VQGTEENDKSLRVRNMFGAIAGRYDILNHFLSANIDRRWRKSCVREIGKRISSSPPRILDIGCGTADLALAFSRLGPVIGCDFCRPMLSIGALKIAGTHNRFRVSLLEADALVLPFADASFDVVVSAFVLRNLEDIDRGYKEMRRVLRPGGALGVLDFGMPKTPLLAAPYRWYFLNVLPKIGRLISGVNGAYEYLPSSVQEFPTVEELRKKAGQAGFIDVGYRLLTAGIAVLLVGNAGQDQAAIPKQTGSS
jgi:demethylmenaquinone methyltransferase/2-methoxy-6-polyprenyl-1,4-benzoquinol methylase